jgi:hypothetical protein
MLTKTTLVLIGIVVIIFLLWVAFEQLIAP